MPLGLADALDDLVFGVFRMFVEHGAERLDDLANGLVEFDFARIASDDILVDVLDALIAPHGYAFVKQRADFLPECCGGIDLKDSNEAFG